MAEKRDKIKILTSILESCHTGKSKTVRTTKDFMVPFRHLYISIY